MDPVEYYGCVGVLIPSLHITDSRTQDLVARPRLVLSFFRFTSSVSFPSFGMNNARWRLSCHSLSPVVFFAHCIFQVATAGDSAGDFKKLTSCWSIFPKRVPPSFCSLFVYWVFMLLYSYLFTCFTLLHCVHIIVVSVGWLWLLGDLCEMSSIPELECT
jgi:hypothetical protein